MPRLMGVNVLGVLLAAIGMFFVGFIWYGMLFTDIWMAARGYDAETMAASSPAWMAGGFAIELVAAFGLGWLMKRAGITKLATAVSFALPLALLIVVPMRSYEYVYGALHHTGGWMVDTTHGIATFLVGAIILSFFD